MAICPQTNMFCAIPELPCAMCKVYLDDLRERAQRGDKRAQSLLHNSNDALRDLEGFVAYIDRNR